MPSTQPATWLQRADIELLIPHRFPIALLDRVSVRDPGREGVGEVRLEPGHPAFAGHFPARPILPGVLMIEACAQLVAVVCSGSDRAAAPGGPQIEYLASVEHFKFLRPVGPGEVLVAETWIGRRVAGLLQARVAASVREHRVAEGVLNITVSGRNP